MRWANGTFCTSEFTRSANYCARNVVGPGPLASAEHALFLAECLQQMAIMNFQLVAILASKLAQSKPLGMGDMVF